jgi:cellulose synthase/poly-beta-1,6-N-acetylglucosamine synthase-like glycosyltransferase
LDTPERILFATYLLVGPGAWLLLALGTWLGRRKMARLEREHHPLPTDPPPVTVLVPAKDEGEGVRGCIESILAQDYPKLAVIAIDDRSADDTGCVLDDVAAKSAGRVRALHVAHGSLPAGWLGKCNALHTGAKDVDTPWLLFVDSDVRLQPNVLSRALALAEARRYDAVTMLTRLECHTFLEKLVLPLAAAAWSIMYAISRTNDDNRPSAAYANGQFLLVRTSAYCAAGGHEAVKDRITEDVELMRRMKAGGARTRFFLGATFASTRMHATLRQMFRGWGRIYSGTSRRSPWRIVAAIVFLLASGFSAYAALAWGVVGDDFRTWLWGSFAHLVVMTCVLAGLYGDSGNPRRNALLFPLGGGVLLAIFAFALKWCATGRIEWRGTTFDQNRPDAATAPVTRP